MWAIVAAIVVGLVGVISYHMTYAISTSFRFDLWRFTTNSYMQWFVDKPTDLDQNALVFVPFVRANSLYLVDAILFWVAIAVLLGLFVYSLFTRNTSKVGFVLSLDFLSFVYFVIQIVYTVFAMQDFTISSDGTKIYGLDSVKGNSGILFNCLCLAGIIWLSILHMRKTLDGDSSKFLPYVTAVVMLISFVLSYQVAAALLVFATPTSQGFSLWVMTRFNLFLILTASVVSGACDYDPLLDPRVAGQLCSTNK